MARSYQSFLAICLVAALGISACATPEPQAFVGDGVASTVLITPDHTIPGKSFRPLGTVAIDPGQPSMFNRFGASCENPLNLAKTAIARYTNVDAIVDFHSETGQCTPGLGAVGVCSKTCAGTAVVYVDAPAPASKSSAGAPSQVPAAPRAKQAVNPNADWPESEYGSY